MTLTKGFEQMKMFLERETGIEPATNGLGSRYSTIELLPLVTPNYRSSEMLEPVGWNKRPFR
jgi:hypothetical protein